MTDFPHLDQPLNLNQVLFERMPMGIAVMDRHFILRQANPTWAGFIAAYAHTPASHVVPGTYLFDLEPGTEDVLIPLFERTLAGETVRQEGVRIETGGTISYWDIVLTPLLQGEQVVGIINLSIDATARVLAHQQLERTIAIQKGQQQYLELLARGGGLSETLHTLVRIIEEQSPGMLGLILLLDEDGKHLHIGASVSLPEEYTRSIEGLEIGPMVGSCGTAAYLRERVIVEDIATDPRWAGLRELGLHYDLRACWSEPVIATDGRVLGTFAMYYRSPRAPTSSELRIITTAAHLAGVAIEHRRGQEALQEKERQLEKRVEERTRELATLFKVQQAITSRLDSRAVLQMIADEALHLTSADQSAVYLLKGNELQVSVISGNVQPELVGYCLPLDGSVAGLAVRSGQSYRIDDAGQDERVYSDIIQRVGARSFIIVPLVSGRGPIGTITVANTLSGRLGEDDERVLTLLASSAVIGLENARLYEQAEESAAAAERSRLARDLHDAVTQTLFSATLIAEVLPRLWKENRREGARRLEELRQLTRGALAEMRTLLLELRPTALTDVPLGHLLNQLAEAAMGSARIPVVVSEEGCIGLPPDVQVALYRIAQEALNNITKHSGATQASISLAESPHQVEMCIADNGRGFDRTTVRSGHLGLGIMHERAQAIGATLNVESKVGRGTEITVVWRIGNA